MFSENDIQKGMRISVWEGAFATVHGTVTTGAFLTGFALMLNANDFQIGLLTAIPLLTQVLQIFSIHAIEKVGRRKWFSGWFSVLGRALWALLVLIPFFPFLKAHAISCFLGIFIIISCCLSLSGAPWLSWMADLVPAKIRGSYFGKRNMILGIMTMVTSISAGQVLDYYKNINALENGYLIIEILAVVCAIIAFGFLAKQPEPPYRRSASYSFRKYILLPFQTRNFRKLLLFYLSFTFAMGLASSYFPVYLLKTLKWSFSNLALLAIGSSIMTLLTQPFWGKMIDRYGHKPVIKATVAGVLPLPVLYIITPPAISWLLWADMIFTGIFWAGFNLVIFNMVIHSLPAEGRPGYLAVQAALIGVTNFFAMILGGFIAQTLSTFHFSFLGYTFINYHILFFLTLLLRLTVFPLIARLEEPGAKPTGVMVRRIFNTINRYISLGYGFWFLGGNNRRNNGGVARSKMEIRK